MPFDRTVIQLQEFHTTIGQDYDGTLLPFTTGFFLCTLAALGVVLVVEKGRLFKAHQFVLK